MNPNVFAIIHTWPDLKNAEYEVLQRLLNAARAVDASAIVIDRNGKVLWAPPELDVAEGKPLDPSRVGFVLSLHFDSGRVVDAYTYFALWQPIEFYHVFGYGKSIDCVTSYNDLLSCDSDLADAHGLNLLAGLGREPSQPLPKLFHTLPEPFLEPKISDTSKIFYIGINWERIGRPKGRFHDALVSLDQRGVTEIYGPEKIQGVAPWEGFETYQGELPFDGEAVKLAINRSGIALVLSSVAHKNSGIMSNRLFEALAGGAAVIATPHPLIDKHFRDVVYLVDDARGDHHLYLQIMEAHRRILADPDEATRRTLLGQAILRERCSLERSVLTLIEDTPRRKAHFERTFLAQAEVTVIVLFGGDDLDACARHLLQFATQRKALVTLHLVCDARFKSRHEGALASLATGSIASLTLHPRRGANTARVFDGIVSEPERSGPTVAAILKTVRTPLFAFSTPDDGVFSDHFGSLAKVLEDQPDAMAACTGLIAQQQDDRGETTRTLRELRFSDFDAIVMVTGEGQVGRFLFRSQLLDERYKHLLPLLDGEEHNYFRLAALLAGTIAQTGYATYVEQEGASVPESQEESKHQQRQFIRDVFARDPRWLDKLSRNSRLPEFVYAYGPGAPLRWDRSSASPETVAELPLNEPLNTTLKGRGLDFLAEGFSPGEAGGTWMAGRSGRLRFRLPRRDDDAVVDYQLILGIVGRRARESGRQQRVAVAVNGHMVTYQPVSDVHQSITVPLPRALVSERAVFEVTLTPDHAEPVYNEAGRVVDDRTLSILLTTMELRLAVSRDPIRFKVGSRYETVTGERGSYALVTGFFPPENDVTWMAGKQGALIFDLDAAPRKARLHLRLRGRKLSTGRATAVKITVNGDLKGEYRLASGPTPLDIDFDEGTLGTRLEIVLAANEVEPVYDEDGEIVDPRLISVGVEEVSVGDDA